MKWIAALAAALVLSACAEPVYNWSKAGPHNFTQDSDGCKREVIAANAAAPRNPLGKEGNHLQPSGEWAQKAYNSCMTALGYAPTRELSFSEAAAVKGPPAPSPVPATSPPSPATSNAAGRLRELRGLPDQGLISQAEYDQRRQAILSSL
jgi:hypothetical protein